MELIANILVSLLTIIAGLVTNILAHDICASADRICAKIIVRAAQRLAPIDRECTELEWLADLSERETVYEKYNHAIGCYLAAGAMRRRAMTISIALKFRVANVGTVPLNLQFKPSLMMTAALFVPGQYKIVIWLRRSIALIFIIYTFSKLLLSARRVGPGIFHRFVNEFKNFKQWEFEAQLQRKNMDIDLSKIFTAMVHNPKRIPEILKAVTKILSQDSNNPPKSNPESASEVHSEKHDG